MLKRYKKTTIPAEYGTIERPTQLDDGSYHISTEKVLLRQESEEYANLRTKMIYETRSERIFVPEKNSKDLMALIKFSQKVSKP